MAVFVIPGDLARSQRPGYEGERGRQVGKQEVDDWLADVRALGIRSIICLLDRDQLTLYETLPLALPAYYESQGFRVCHVPAKDHQHPPLSPEHLRAVWAAYQELPKPVLVHCSAGMDRTGKAVEYIQERLREV